MIKSFKQGFDHENDTQKIYKFLKFFVIFAPFESLVLQKLRQCSGSLSPSLDKHIQCKLSISYVTA